MEIGLTIRGCRIREGLSLEELATMSDVDKSYLSLLERGKRNINLRVLERICEALKVPVVIIVFLATDRDKLSTLNQNALALLAYEAQCMIGEARK